MGKFEIDLKDRFKLEKRFWLKVDRSAGPDGCWPFTLKPEKAGYGVWTIEGRQWRAHRVAWILANGRNIPVDKPHILHSCDNPICVNPKHLRAGTNQENNDDKVRRKRSGNLKPDACHRGHPRTPEHYRAYYSTPYKVCKTCLNEKAMERYYRLKEAHE